MSCEFGLGVHQFAEVESLSCYIMLVRLYRPVRTLLRRSDFFGVKPTLHVRDRDKELSLTVIASFVFYFAAALLVYQQIGKFIDQSQISSFSTSQSSVKAVCWKVGSDINITLEVPVANMKQLYGLDLTTLQPYIRNQGKQLLLVEGNATDGIRSFKLLSGNQLCLKGWNRSESAFQPLSIRMNCSAEGAPTDCSDIPFKAKLGVWSFDRHSDNATLKQITLEKQTYNSKKKFRLELSAVVSQSDSSSSPYQKLTKVTGVRLDETTVTSEVDQSGEGDSVSIQLGQIVHYFTFAAFKYHRYVSNVGNFVTTLNIMVLLLFFEFNSLNKYTRACVELYIVKYVDQGGNLVVQNIRPSVFDFFLPFCKAIGYCSTAGKLKLKAVSKLKRETDIEYMIKRAINLEKTLDETTICQINRYLIQRFFPDRSGPPILTQSFLEPPIISTSLTEPPIVQPIGPPIIPIDEPPIIPKIEASLKIRKMETSIEHQVEIGNPTIVPRQVVIGSADKIKLSGLSIPSTVHTYNSQPTTASQPNSSYLLQSKKVREFLRLSGSSQSSNSTLGRSRPQILMEMCSRNTLEQLTKMKQPSNIAVEQSLGTSISPFMLEMEVRAVEHKAERIKRFLKFMRNSAHDLLSRFDFFSWSINFEVEAHQPKGISEVGGFCTLVIVWFTLAAMFLDILSFFRVEHQIIRFDYHLGPEEFANAKLSLNNLELYIFAHNLSSDRIVSYEKINNFTTAEIQLTGHDLHSIRSYPISNLSPESRNLLLGLPFIQREEDIRLGQKFILPQTTQLTAEDWLQLEFNFECAHKVCEQDVFNHTVLQVVVSSEKLDSTSNKFVKGLEFYTVYYNFINDQQIAQRDFTFSALLLEADQTTFPIKQYRSYTGYQFNKAFEQQSMPPTENNGRNIRLAYKMSDKVVKYEKSTVKVDQFIGNLEGVLLFGLCWVAITSLYLNRRKMHYCFGRIFNPDKQGFSWKRLVLESIMPKHWNRQSKGLTSVLGIARKGKQLLELDNLTHRIRRLERYSQLPLSSDIERDFQKVYIKELQQPPTKTAQYRSRSTIVHTLSKIGGSMLANRSQAPSFSKVEVREHPQPRVSKYLQAAWQRLSHLDMFDQPVKLNYRGQSKYSSGFTQLISLLLIIGIFAMFSFYLREYVLNGDTSIHKSTSSTSTFKVDRHYTEQFELEIRTRNSSNQKVATSFLTNLLPYADLRLLVGDQPIEYSMITDSTSAVIHINSSRFNESLDKNMFTIEFVERQIDNIEVQMDLQEELMRVLIKMQIQVCMVNFKFSPDSSTMEHYGEPVLPKLECTEYLSMPVSMISRKTIPLELVQVTQQHYHLGLVRTTSHYNFYNFDGHTVRNNYYLKQHAWSFAFCFQFNEVKTKYSIVPSNLNVVTNKLIGALSVFVFLFLFLTRINRTRFVLELGCSLYRNQVGAVTFMDAIKIFVLKHLPQLIEVKYTNLRCKELLRLYRKTSEHLSLMKYLRRIRRLQQGIYRGMTIEELNQLHINLKEEVTNHKNMNPEEHRENNLLKRQLKSSSMYTHLSKDIGFTDNEIIQVLPALALPQDNIAVSSQKKLRRLRSLLP